MGSLISTREERKQQGKQRSYTETQRREKEPKRGNYTLDTLDTVTLAKQEREKQGTWEVEVSYGGEADLHRHHKTCDKNPGHQNFIPVHKFNVEHLPPGYHDNDLVDYVRAMSDITVRVLVKYVSENRPETVPGTDMPYPCYRDRGRDMARYGTGWIDDVRKFPKKYESETICQCKECVNSNTPKTRFARIDIRTAAHVVYDQLEGDRTTCHLFFDRGNTPGSCSGVVTLSGMSEVRSDTQIDCCWMYYYTHDMALADRLKKMVYSWDCIYDKVLIEKVNKLETRMYAKQYDDGNGDQIPESIREGEPLTIIVSHPHGCSKQVSVGYCTRTNIPVFIEDTLTYTTPTCPGSSGAFVCVLEKASVQVYLDCHHCGIYDYNRELNYCRLST